MPILHFKNGTNWPLSKARSLEVSFALPPLPTLLFLHDLSQATASSVPKYTLNGCAAQDSHSFSGLFHCSSILGNSSLLASISVELPKWSLKTLKWIRSCPCIKASHYPWSRSKFLDISRSSVPRRSHALLSLEPSFFFCMCLVTGWLPLGFWISVFFSLEKLDLIVLNNAPYYSPPHILVYCYHCT